MLKTALEFYEKLYERDKEENGKMMGQGQGEGKKNEKEIPEILR